jgi:hypothetical protein
VSAAAGEPVGPIIEIGNEFTIVHAQAVSTRNGMRLELRSPRMGFSIQLDPLELESLTWQTTETFSKLLETPYGPGAELHAELLSDLIDTKGDGDGES